MTTIYPAIDIIGGKCVRLTKGDYDTSIIYDSDPLKVALGFQEQGASHLHIVDLDAAKKPDGNNRSIIKNIIEKTELLVQTGGGIRTLKDVESLLNVGANRLIIGSSAVTNRLEVFQWINAFGSDKIVIGADVSDRKIATHGWLKVSEETIIDFIKEYMDQGAKYFLCTDISKDGMLQGAALDLYKEIISKFNNIQLIASGGVHSLDEIKKLEALNMESIIIGKALYEGVFSLSDVFNAISKQ